MRVARHRRSTACASSLANHGSTARALRYFTRAASSRATPSYANSATQSSTNAGARIDGAATNVDAHASHTTAPLRPHPAHSGGNSRSTNAMRWTVRAGWDTHPGFGPIEPYEGEIGPNT